MRQPRHPIVFQPRKVERSGLFDAVEGRVLIHIHKERELDDVERRYPAEHYTIERIGDLLHYDLPALLTAAPGTEEP